MEWHEILSVIGSICSIFALFIALFIAKKVMSISVVEGGAANINGSRNTVIGRDGYVEKD